MNRDRIIIYTDGGCSPNPGLGGWSAILVSPGHNNYSKELSGVEPDSTNNRMELTAAIMALRSLKRPCKVIVHTDSQYLQKAFTEGWLDKWTVNGWKTTQKKSVANEELWKNLLELIKKHEVSWVWVKGHSDDALNERCDQLVTLARINYQKEVIHNT